MQIKHIKITPSKTLYQKLGDSSHGFNESMADLIDNCLDAATPEQLEGKEKLKVLVKYDKIKNVVIVQDNAGGMDESQAAKAISLGHSDKNDKDLGKYGLGMKTSALALGKRFDVVTGQKGDKNAYVIEYDVDEWESNSALSWEKFPLGIMEKDKDFHGTTITISRLKIKFTQGKLDYLITDIAKRYRGFLIEGNLEIIVDINGHKHKCTPQDIPWAATPTDIDIDVPGYGKITGKMGLMVKGSQTGLYGLDLFRHGRMISMFAKFGIQSHPTMAKIYGTLNLDFVPVTHEKNRFIEDSPEYEAALEAFREDPVVKDIIKTARKVSTEDKITKNTQNKIEDWMDCLDGAMGSDILKDMLNQNATQGKVSGKIGEPKKPIETSPDGEIAPVEVEKRNHPGGSKGSAEPTGKRPERKPRETHTVARRVIHVNGKTFKYRHEFINDEGLGRKNFVHEVAELAVYTNTMFPAFSATEDIGYYVVNNIAESIAEFCIRETGGGIQEKNNIQDKILEISARLKEQLQGDVNDLVDHAKRRIKSAKA